MPDGIVDLLLGLVLGLSAAAIDLWLDWPDRGRKYR
jgi:hypothetical protein